MTDEKYTAEFDGIIKELKLSQSESYFLTFPLTLKISEIKDIIEAIEFYNNNQSPPNLMLELLEEIKDQIRERIDKVEDIRNATPKFLKSLKEEK